MFMPHATPVVRALTSAATQGNVPASATYNHAPPLLQQANAAPPAVANAATAAVANPTLPPAHQATYQAILAALSKEPLSWGAPGTATGAGAFTTPTRWVHSNPGDEASGYRPYVPTPITAGMPASQVAAIRGEGPRSNLKYTYAAAPSGFTWGTGRTTMGDSGATRPFSPEMLAHAEASGYVPVGTPLSAVQYTPGGGGAGNWMVQPMTLTPAEVASGRATNWANVGSYGNRIPIIGQGLGTDMMPTVGYAPNPMPRPFSIT
jgi:hypothetical protein